MIEERTVKIAKETDDVMTLFVKVIKVVKSGGDYTSLISALINAIEGATDISNEFKKEMRVALNTVGGRTGDIVEAFQIEKVQEESEG